jgi:hypothetical protein
MLFGEGFTVMRDEYNDVTSTQVKTESSRLPLLYPQNRLGTPRVDRGSNCYRFAVNR